MKFSFIFLILLFFIQSVFSQCGFTLSGTILDKDSKEPMNNSSIYLPSKNITILASNGVFKIDSLCAGHIDIEITHQGCKTEKYHIRIKNSTSLNFELSHLFNELEQVSVSAQQQFAITKNTIGEKDLQAAKGLSLAEGIAKINGVSLLQTGTNIFKPIIQGLHSNRILILNNGIRHEAQQWGSDHAPEIDFYLANKLTVIKGSGALRYGADAIGGVVIVEPKILPFIDGINTEVNTAYFSNNRQATLSALLEGKKAKSNFAWRVQATVSKAGNSQTPDYWLKNTGREEINFSIAMGWKKTNKNTELFFSNFNTQIGIFAGSHIGNTTDLINTISLKDPPYYIRNTGFTYNINRPRQAVSHSLVKFKKSIFKNKNTFTHLISAQYNNRKEYDLKRFASSKNNPQLDLKIITVSNDFNWQHSWFKNWNGNVGYNIAFQNNSYQYRLFIPNYTALQAGVYLTEKMNIKKGSLEMGLRYDLRNTFNIKKNNESPFPTKNFNNISASVGINKNVVSEKNMELNFISNLSTAWRAPQTNELFVDGLHHGAARIEKGNANLLSEKAINLNIGVVFSNKNLQVEINSFAKKINNFIFLKPSYPPQLTIRGAFPLSVFNQTNAFLYGSDFTLNYNASAHINLAGKFSFLYAKDLSNKMWIINMPTNNAAFDFTYNFIDSKKMKNTSVKTNLQFFAQQKRVPNTGNIELKNVNGITEFKADYLAPPQAYSLLNVEAFTTINIFHKPINIILTGNNILNKSYRSYLNSFRYFSDEMGRNVFLKLNFNLNK